MKKKGTKLREANVSEYIVLREIVDINTVPTIQQQLLDRLLKEDAIYIDASKVSKITTPGIQLIISLCNYAKETKRELAIYNPSEVFNSSLNEFGLANNPIVQKIINR